jgi:type II secretory pathway component PulF
MSTAEQTRRTRGLGLAVFGALTHAGLALALFGLLVWYVPAAKRTFDEYGLALPLATQSVIRLSNWVAGHWWALGPFLVFGAVGNFVLLRLLGREGRFGPLVWIAGGTLVLGAAVALTVVTIELPMTKLREALAN